MAIAHVNGIDINYEVHGDGTPLVLAPAFLGTVDMWREQVPALSASHRLVLYDTRGHGHSSAPADVNAYSLAREYVADQVALMDHLGIETAYVGGLSMGGFIAQEFALQHPHRVKGLLLFDTAPTWAPEAKDIVLALVQLARTQGMSVVVEALRAAAGSGDALPAAVTRFTDRIGQMSVDGFAGGTHALANWPGTLERINAIDVPTLILIGEQDSLLEQGREMHLRIQGSRLVVIKDCNHGSNMLKPGLFGSATLDFLSGVAMGETVSGSFEIT